MQSNMRFIKSALEYREVDELHLVPKNLRGLYALYRKRGRSYDAVYIGMSGSGEKGRIKSRLISHKRSPEKEWTHFSYYEVWDNISDSEIKELEGLFRQIYRFDSRANSLNKQQSHKPLLKTCKETENTLGLGRVTKRTLGV